MTKQTALVSIASVFVYYIIFNRTKFRIVAPLSVMTIVLIILALNYRTDGWLYYYMFKLPSQHKLGAIYFKAFLTQDMVPLTVVMILSLIQIYLSFNKDIKKGWYYILLAAGTIFGSGFARSHAGGYVNVLIPLFAVLSILAGIGYHSLIELLSENCYKRKFSVVGLVLLGGLTYFQFISLYYNPMEQIPDEASKQAGYAIQDNLKQIPGEVLMSSRPYMLTEIGKTSSAHSYAISDIFRGTDENLKTQLFNEIEAAIQQKKYMVIVYDNQTILPQDYSKYYEKSNSVFPVGDTKTFYPVAGYWNRPELILVPVSN